MVIYDLRCEREHVFEAWFRGAAEFVKQRQSGLVHCPWCDSREIAILPNSHISVGGRGRRQEHEAGGEPCKTDPSDPKTAEPEAPRSKEYVREFRQYVEHNFHDVGTQFPEEARKIHYGEVEHRNIYGQATSQEISELSEEGIKTASLPLALAPKPQLN